MFQEPIHVTDATYEQAVLKSALPVVVDFWAPWCGPCKMMGPLLDAAAQKYAGKLVVAKDIAFLNSGRFAIKYPSI